MEANDDATELAALLAEHVTAVELHIRRVRSGERPINRLYLAQMMTAIRQSTAALEAALMRGRE